MKQILELGSGTQLGKNRHQICTKDLHCTGRRNPVDYAQPWIRFLAGRLSGFRRVSTEFEKKKRSTKKELSSLAGVLQHAAIVVHPGRTFIRRIYNLLGTVKLPSHHLRLTSEFRSNLACWATFLGPWNGVKMMSQADAPLPSIKVTSDASGSWGCGAFWSQSWFQM